jgi:hypothetical protein
VLRGIGRSRTRRGLRDRDKAVSGKAGLDTLAIQDLLEAHGSLASIWSVEDVHSVRPDLTDEQSREVLSECNRQHGAEAGVNAVADELFPPHGK